MVFFIYKDTCRIKFIMIYTCISCGRFFIPSFRRKFKDKILPTEIYELFIHVYTNINVHVNTVYKICFPLLLTKQVFPLLQYGLIPHVLHFYNCFSSACCSIFTFWKICFHFWEYFLSKFFFLLILILLCWLNMCIALS